MEEYVNFGSVECGQSSSAVVHLRNTSSAHCLYQVLLVIKYSLLLLLLVSSGV